MGFVPLFVFWAAEDPLSTSGHDWVAKPIIHSSCLGDVASTGTNANRQTHEQTGKDHIC